LSEKKAHRKALPKGTKNYVWTLFRPRSEALAQLAELVEERRLNLAIGVRKPFAQAVDAFDHVRKGKPGRALLTL